MIVDSLHVGLSALLPVRWCSEGLKAWHWLHTMQGLDTVQPTTNRRLPEGAGQPGAWSRSQAKADSATSLVGQDVEGGAVTNAESRR